MKQIDDNAVHAFGVLRALKKLRHRFASEEEYQRAFNSHLAEIPDELKIEVLANMVFHDARALLIFDLWRERWEGRKGSIADTLFVRKRRRQWFEELWF